MTLFWFGFIMVCVAMAYLIVTARPNVKYDGEEKIPGEVVNEWQSRGETVYQIKAGNNFLEFGQAFVQVNVKVGDKVAVWASKSVEKRLLPLPMIPKEKTRYRPHNDRNIELLKN